MGVEPTGTVAGLTSCLRFSVSGSRGGVGERNGCGRVHMTATVASQVDTSNVPEQSHGSGGEEQRRRGVQLVSLRDIQQAARDIRGRIVRTPLLTSTALDDIVCQAVSQHGHPEVRVRLAFKAEHLQVVGAFKSRGAANAIQQRLNSLRTSNPAFDPKNLCVLTHSSGNHGAALACQAKNAGVQAAVVMPRTAPEVKKQNVASYGARVWYCEPDVRERERVAAEARKELESEGKVVEFIHPYDDPAIIAGQGTMGEEMMQQARLLGGDDGSTAAPLSCTLAAEAKRPPGSDMQPTHDGSNGAALSQSSPLDIVIAPVGGGGMLSGVATAVKAIDGRCIVVGAEPAAADDAHRSFTTRVLQPAVTPPQTICDGLLTSLSERTLAHIEARVDLIATAPDSAVLRALGLVTDKMKQLIEPSAAIGLATLLENSQLQDLVRQVHARKGTEGDDGPVRIGIVWSGGNTTVQTLAEHLSRRRQ
ncbi:unnamed protein product [Parajaminaea phylloscopi]